MLKEAGILFAITLIAGLLLGFVYELTKEPIRQQEEKAVQEACQAVFADAEHFEELDAYTPSADTAQKLADTGITIGTVYEAQDASGTQLGYVIQTTTSEGYGGNIVLSRTGHESGRCAGAAVPQQEREELCLHQDRIHF